MKEIERIINGRFGGSDTILLVQYGSTVSDLAKAIEQFIKENYVPKESSLMDEGDTQ
jgi:hypothetical protein